MGCEVSQEKAMKINKGGDPEKKLENNHSQKNNDQIIRTSQSPDDDDDEDDDDDDDDETDDSNSKKSEEEKESLPKDPLSIIIMGMEQNMYEKKEPDITLKEFREELTAKWEEIQKTRPKLTYHQFVLEHDKIKDN